MITLGRLAYGKTEVWKVEPAKTPLAPRAKPVPRPAAIEPTVATPSSDPLIAIPFTSVVKAELLNSWSLTSASPHSMNWL